MPDRPGTTPIPDLQWRELCAQLRATDDISFKLLGFVPLFSVATMAALLLKTDARLTLPLVVACFVGALTTLGFWIWERRNIQTCEWLRERAADLERAAYGADHVGQFARFPVSPRGRGKTQGEKVVYASTLTAWLLVPLSTLPNAAATNSALTLLAYALGSAAIAGWAWREFAAPIAPTPRDATRATSEAAEHR